MGNPTPIWEDEVGEMQVIPQGEGGDQGDPLMSLLFSLALHPSLRSAAKLLREGKRSSRFWMTCISFARQTGCWKCFASLRRLCGRSRISVHFGKTQLWNSPELPERSIHKQSCGEAIKVCQLNNRVSPFWDHQWAMTSSSE